MMVINVIFYCFTRVVEKNFRNMKFQSSRKFTGGRIEAPRSCCVFHRVFSSSRAFMWELSQQSKQTQQCGEGAGGREWLETKIWKTIGYLI